MDTAPVSHCEPCGFTAATPSGTYEFKQRLYEPVAVSGIEGPHVFKRNAAALLVG